MFIIKKLNISNFHINDGTLFYMMFNRCSRELIVKINKSLIRKLKYDKVELILQYFPKTINKIFGSKTIFDSVMKNSKKFL